jgi:hypothetical protein
MWRVLTKLIQKFNLFSHRLTLIPDEELFKTPCSHCGKPSSEQWLQGVCADFRTRGQYMAVCTECDIVLNEMHLRFFFGSERDKDLEDYADYKRRLDRLRSLSKTSIDSIDKAKNL